MSEPKQGASRRGNAGKGRRTGSKNKLTATIKEALEAAFHEVGGQKYLVRMASAEPRAFMTLLGKAMPQQIDANVHAALLPGSIDDFIVPPPDVP